MVGVALEVLEYESITRRRLTACPFCGHQFEEYEPRWKHYLDDHGPEDVGRSGGVEP